MQRRNTLVHLVVLVIASVTPTVILHAITHTLDTDAFALVAVYILAALMGYLVLSRTAARTHASRLYILALVGLMLFLGAGSVGLMTGLAALAGGAICIYCHEPKSEVQ